MPTKLEQVSGLQVWDRNFWNEFCCKVWFTMTKCFGPLKLPPLPVFNFDIVEPAPTMGHTNHFCMLVEEVLVPGAFVNVIVYERVSCAFAISWRFYWGNCNTILESSTFNIIMTPVLGYWEPRGVSHSLTYESTSACCMNCKHYIRGKSVYRKIGWLI